MANHDYVIDNGSGSTVRADINNALQAIASVNSSATEPSTVVDKMLWHDTTSNALKQRNSGSFTGLRLFDPRIINTGLLDANGNEAVGITATASAVNEITIANAASGNNPVISATGSDTNINLTLTPKGTASIFVPAGSVTNPSISTSTNSNTGIYFPSADTMGFVEGGTGYQMGYRNVPSAGADKTTNYTLQLSDRGKLVSIGASGQITVPNAVFSAGDIIYVYNNTGSPFNINRGTNAQLYKSGVDSDVGAIAVPTRTIGAIQYVSSSRAVFFSGSQDDITFQLEYVIVGGGGGGGAQVGPTSGGGGGAGGYINSLTGESYGGGGIKPFTVSITPSTTQYTVTVGAGGASSTSGSDSVFGNSVFGFTAASGGGRGANSSLSAGSGGSGGGGYSTTMTPGSGTANQGYSGGSSLGGSNYQGGGGGAGAVGSNSISGGPAGAGGAGLSSSITGTSVTRAGGGGGGGVAAGTGGAGGSGGGGAGGSTGSPAVAGTANTGGGGGGAHTAGSSGGAGGSGVVILRYVTADYSGTRTTTGSPSVTTSGIYTILTFNSSGSVTFGV